MTPDPQLQTKQVIGIGLDVIGFTIPIGFRLPRGKVARIWGFVYVINAIGTLTVEYSLFVRKKADAVRELTPKDNLWALINTLQATGTGRSYNFPNQIMFPKPYRTTGISVQMHASIGTNSSGELIVYYDIDDMLPGEATQKLEKSVQRGIARSTSEFD